MKQLIAKRKLQRKCNICNRVIKKGDVYYKERVVFEDEDWDCNKIYAYNIYRCPKCIWKANQHSKRYVEFTKVCKHPHEFRHTHYSYIPGEAVKEPSHDQCLLCGKVI